MSKSRCMHDYVYGIFFGAMNDPGYCIYDVNKSEYLQVYAWCSRKLFAHMLGHSCNMYLI
jgi:hypothetical protein